MLYQKLLQGTQKMKDRKKQGFSLLRGRSLVVGVGDSAVLCSTGVILLASSCGGGCGATCVALRLPEADMIPDAAERPRAASYSLSRLASLFKLTRT